jgi:hypothetical protein
VTGLTEEEREALDAIHRIGGGTVLKAIQMVMRVWVTSRQLSRILAKLQRRGLAFCHSGRGTLAIWRPGFRCQFWSSREYLESVGQEGLPPRM